MRHREKDTSYARVGDIVGVERLVEAQIGEVGLIPEN